MKRMTDEELAQEIRSAVHSFHMAVEEAVRCGLLVEVEYTTRIVELVFEEKSGVFSYPSIPQLEVKILREI